MLQQPVTALKLGDPDDGDYGRQQRGLMIAALANITKDPWGYKVPAQSRSGSYLVNLEYGAVLHLPGLRGATEALQARIRRSSRSPARERT